MAKQGILLSQLTGFLNVRSLQSKFKQDKHGAISVYLYKRLKLNFVSSSITESKRFVRMDCASNRVLPCYYMIRRVNTPASYNVN